MDAITAAHDGDIQMIDSTSVRAHQQAATAKRGIQIIGSIAHGVVSRPKSTQSSAQGLPIRLSLTAGQAHDGPVAYRLLDRFDRRTIALADKPMMPRDLIETQGAVPNIPAKSNRKWNPCFSKRLYRERNLVERFFSKFKHFRRIATRHYKLADNFFAMAQLTSLRLWLRANDSTA